MPERLKEFVEVIIDTTVSELDRPFHYAVPPALREKVDIGSLVLVPFSGRLSLAYVVGFPASADVARLKEVSRVLDEPPLFDFDSQRLCRWIAARYLCSLSQAFRLVMPPGRARKVQQQLTLDCEHQTALFALAGAPTEVLEGYEAIRAAGGGMTLASLKRQLGAGGASAAVTMLEQLGLMTRSFSLSRPEVAAKSRLMVRLPDLDTPLDGLPLRQRDIVEHLMVHGGAALQSELLKETGASSASLKSLARKGLVEVAPEEVLRRPRLRDGSTAEGRPEPNRWQRAAIDQVNECIDARRHRVFLLEGVTGSGKTEVYLRCIEWALSLGRSAIVLVPEISLTPQTLDRFESRFPGNVAVLHSRLSPGERYDQWRAIREGRHRVVVGARSALFAPVADLGVIAIDEEHESSYKSDKAPRYHAREVAEARARMSGAVVVLGSATPAFESSHRAAAGTYGHLVLPERIDSRPLPTVEVVDMRDVGGAGVVPLVSLPMLDALSRTVEAGEQAILFLNRRGFANYLQCRACGHIMGCDECEVSLCFHTTSSPSPRREEGELSGVPRNGRLMCHHCGKGWRVPAQCPECGKGPLATFGAGTQRVEDEVRRHLPGVSLIRMDADTTATKDAHWHLLGRFRAGEAQVLVGTQMIAKGLDIPGVTLVGVINADTALALPDFRAAERTYQLLTQVSGRAGRGLKPGRVIVQTFSPEHPAVRAVSGEVEPFMQRELETRLHARYPPFADLLNVLISSESQPAASRSAERVKKVLESELAGTGAAVLGPAPAPLSRLRGNYRWHVLVKCSDLEAVADRVKSAMARYQEYAKQFPPVPAVKVALDVDPASLL